MHDMQIGSKKDSTGWEVYENCTELWCDYWPLQLNIPITWYHQNI